MDQPSRRCESIENKVLSFNKTELDFIRLMMTSSLVDHMHTEGFGTFIRRQVLLTFHIDGKAYAYTSSNQELVNI